MLAADACRVDEPTLRAWARNNETQAQLSAASFHSVEPIGRRGQAFQRTHDDGSFTRVELRDDQFADLHIGRPNGDVTIFYGIGPDRAGQRVEFCAATGRAEVVGASAALEPVPPPVAMEVKSLHVVTRADSPWRTGDPIPRLAPTMARGVAAALHKLTGRP